MTKQKLQQELKEKVKEGIRPSHLKRSKSLSDIPSAPPLPTQSNPQVQQLEQKVQQLKEQLAKVNDD
jgi:polyhydroxyalkanoate synthesis regulator phasin